MAPIETSALIRNPGEMDALLERVWASAPHDAATEDTWLFVYGSMLENPPFEAVGRSVATLHGFSRRFCLADPMLRGTETKPGLTLGLEPGDQCVGLAWRLAHGRAKADVQAFWPGEMQLPLYQACWRPVAVSGHGVVQALALLADLAGPLFEGDLTNLAIADRIATSAGSKGSNADYLFEAATGLRRAGIADQQLEDLVTLVKARRTHASSQD